MGFHLFSSNHGLEYPVAAGSLAIPADSPNVMTVGAVPYGTPATLEPFSSQGPTEDGRTKPDLVAPDGVANATYGAFAGTSAAAPHAAGAAALVLARYPSYTPAAIQSFLEGLAVDLGDAGKDNLFGSGRLHLGSSADLSVTTNAATDITNDSAVLNGSLDGLGSHDSVVVSFEWAPVAGSGSSSVVPSAFESAVGPGNNFSPFGSSPTRYQQVYAASGMGGSGIIDKIAFRLDEMVAEPGFSDQIVDLEVRFSHVTY